MTGPSDPSDSAPVTPGAGTTPRPTKNPRGRRRRWPWFVGAFLIFLELLAGQFVARPNRILRHSADPDLVYENTPGNWLGHAKYDVWRAPLYMVLDLIYAGPSQNRAEAPPGYTLYRIDRDGCRVPSTGPIAPRNDVVVIGSSQAFGMLVPAEDTLPFMLEASLRARGFADSRVANCGVIGHHFIQSLRTAEVVRPSKQPKLFVVIVRPWHLLEQFDYTQVLTPQNRALRWTIDHSNLARLGYYLYRRERDQFNKPPIPAAVLEARIDRYLGDASAHGARSVFFLVDSGDVEGGGFDALEAMLRRRGQPVSRVLTPNNRSDLFIDHDQHWSARGAAWATSEMIEAVARELRAAGVTPR